MKRTWNKIKVNYGLLVYANTCPIQIRVLFCWPDQTESSVLLTRPDWNTHVKTDLFYTVSTFSSWSGVRSGDSCSFLYVFDFSDFSRRILQQNEIHNYSLYNFHLFFKRCWPIEKVWRQSEIFTEVDILLICLVKNFLNISKLWSLLYLLFFWLNQILTKSFYFNLFGVSLK